MTKIEELAQTYMKDVELASSKQKFGFFSIPPSAFAVNTSFEQKNIQKDQNGKVKTEERNIFSGLCASGVLKKTFFSYPQYKTGDIYMDPGKADRARQMKQNQKYKEKQTFRPASLNKTISSASYEYVPQKQSSKDPKKYRNQDGKVRTQNPNIMSSPQSKINYKSSSQLKYICEPYDNAKLQRRKQLLQDISKRGENPFKPSSPVKELFTINREQFQLPNLPQKKEKHTNEKIQQHESEFKPAGNHFNDGIFSYPKYMPQPQDAGSQNKLTQGAKLVQEEKKVPFKLIKQQKNTKPCPSISLSKMNLMRCLR